MNHVKQLIGTFFGRRWWWVTLLVLLLMVLLARLGFWQLDRLQERREANLILAATLAEDALDLENDLLPQELAGIKNRSAVASGRFDFERQVMLKVQNWQGSAGAHLITPLVFADGETAVLVDRGWIPEVDNNPDGRAQYDIPGQVTVTGFIALSQALAGRTPEAEQEAQDQWYRVDIEGIQGQMPYELLPIYVLQAPEGNTQPPFRSEPDIELSEGNHLSYAVQWFIFSLGLGTAYVIFVRKQMRESKPS